MSFELLMSIVMVALGGGFLRPIHSFHLAIIRYVIRGAFLVRLWAPDITTAIINGRKPPQLTAKALMRLTPRLPVGWAEQRKLLGFR